MERKMTRPAGFNTDEIWAAYLECDYATAERLARQRLDELEKLYPNRIETATTLNWLALLLHIRGQRVEAAKVRERVLRIVEQEYPDRSSWRRQ